MRRVRAAGAPGLELLEAALSLWPGSEASFAELVLVRHPQAIRYWRIGHRQMPMTAQRACQRYITRCAAGLPEGLGPS